MHKEVLDNHHKALPRIEIRPVIFQGTYDEKNWDVLQQRWDDLRAQLHGVVISPQMASKLADPGTAKDINDAAPNFSPSSRCGPGPEI